MASQPRRHALWAAEVEICGMASGGAVAAPSRMGCRGCGRGVPSREHARGWMLRAKALVGVLAGGYDGGALGRRFLVGGVTLEIQLFCTRFLG